MNCVVVVYYWFSLSMFATDVISLVACRVVFARQTMSNQQHAAAILFIVSMLRCHLFIIILYVVIVCSLVCYPYGYLREFNIVL